MSVQEITIRENDVVGPPLVLDFAKVFLRNAVAPETDIVFDAQGLSRCADTILEGRAVPGGVLSCIQPRSTVHDCQLDHCCGIEDKNGWLDQS